MKFIIKNSNTCLNIFNFYIILYSHKFFIIYLEFLLINLLLILITWIYNDIKLQIIIIYILTLTAIETAIGLDLFLFYYKLFKNIKVYYFYIFKFIIQKKSKIIYDNLIDRILKFILLQNFYKMIFIIFILKRLFNNNYK